MCIRRYLCLKAAVGKRKSVCLLTMCVSIGAFSLSTVFNSKTEFTETDTSRVHRIQCFYPQCGTEHAQTNTQWLNNVDRLQHQNKNEFVIGKTVPNGHNDSSHPKTLKAVHLNHVHLVAIKPFQITTPLPEVRNLQNDYYKLSKKIINNVDHSYIINNTRICSNGSVQMLIIVPSSPSNTAKRLAIRRTYGLLSKNRISVINGLSVDLLVRTVFVLGKSSNTTVENRVRKENRDFRDIVQVDFVDSYYNLTLKVLHGLKWARIFCSDVQYVVKVDDDVFLNTAELIHQLKTHSFGSSEAVFGTVFRKQLAVQRTGKWAVSKDQFPLNKYPVYSQGNCYTMSGALAGKIVTIVQHLPYLPIEDAFITGIVAGRFLGAKLIKILGNSNWKEKHFVPNPCNFVKYNFVSTTNMTPRLMYKTWNALKSYKTSCALFIYHKHSTVLR